MQEGEHQSLMKQADSTEHTAKPNGTDRIEQLKREFTVLGADRHLSASCALLTPAVSGEDA